jgi:hypothetical protein
MLNHLKKLLADATPGPWPVGYIYWSFRQVEKSGCEGVYQHMDGTEISDEESGCCPGKEDAPFIAAAVNALPLLFAVVEAARSIADDSFPGSNNDDYRALQKAIAKLNEVQQ